MNFFDFSRSRHNFCQWSVIYPPQGTRVKYSGYCFDHSFDQLWLTTGMPAVTGRMAFSCLSGVRGLPNVQQEEQEYLPEGALYIADFPGLMRVTV